ncbi:hypothetical protein ACIBKZ_06320 [Streptomyces sp. NPDC050421]|uniref:hypothetical protein n=1 Tax=Streptomyces sp. NPDC050421 TaxID=3365613 RepID=UPI0037ACA782
MTDRGWYDDSDYNDALQQAEHAERFGWAAIAGTVGALGCALVALAVVCVGAVAACLYVVMAADY